MKTLSNLKEGPLLSLLFLLVFIVTISFSLYSGVSHPTPVDNNSVSIILNGRNLTYTLIFLLRSLLSVVSVVKFVDKRFSDDEDCSFKFDGSCIAWDCFFVGGQF